MSSGLADIGRAETDADILACFDVMRELRPHLLRDEFLAAIRRMTESDHYHLACGRADGHVVAVAGYRFATYLAWGSTLYVDDLVTAEAARSNGYGRAMLVWLTQEADRHGCAQLHLDSGVWRKDAHRFYEREELEKIAYHYIRAVGRAENKGEGDS